MKRVGWVLTSIRTTTAREEVDGVVRGASAVKADATLGQVAHDEGIAGLVVVDARGDDIPLLVRRAGTIDQGDRDQVLPEVTSGGVDEEALAVGGPDLHVAERTHGGAIEGLSLGDGSGVQGAASAGDGDGGSGAESQDGTTIGSSGCGGGSFARGEIGADSCRGGCQDIGVAGGRSNCHGQGALGAGGGGKSLNYGCLRVGVGCDSRGRRLGGGLSSGSSRGSVGTATAVSSASSSSTTKGEGLVGISSVAVSDVDDIALDCEARAGLVLGLEGERSGSALEAEELRVGNLATYTGDG